VTVSGVDPQFRPNVIPDRPTTTGGRQLDFLRAPCTGAAAKDGLPNLKGGKTSGGPATVVLQQPASRGASLRDKASVDPPWWGAHHILRGNDRITASLDWSMMLG
jgi:hypothetical protein